MYKKHYHYVFKICVIIKIRKGGLIIYGIEYSELTKKWCIVVNETKTIPIIRKEVFENIAKKITDDFYKKT